MGDARSARQAEALKALRRLYDTAYVNYRDIERRAGMPAAHLRALAELVRRPDSSAAQLAAALGVRPATVSNVLKVLAREGLLERRQERRDQRIARLRATPKGARLVEASEAGGALSAALGMLGDAEFDALELGLRALLARLRGAIDAGR